MKKISDIEALLEDAYGTILIKLIEQSGNEDMNRFAKIMIKNGCKPSILLNSIMEWNKK